ncbi:hypothetical protein A2291_04590 [candidate division WOR-1 bacterium RIFOXYB2_FULL_42_35]|uniref:Uncharacterized protein n=1 Tax=candidate division WOR-1 bacterium RIFOXYC2_FULL_41_25 TaxID=1802586 RepID=A0A1F4TRB9_UNCSA|nr:MAG: hypothetical protein A2247_07705 [candidate division WOR-1 bacterium RIFOXYA2_FULL_41_14]OGC25850.1 MAG: hypothetical protein A2291_04590 [candidate division WOR-1 bacterium RIFOXYB2_FULL_42_35]OGC35292.1 MAG: hypothetical protein A2462_08580 [candidate division WOR-1 bacterium RIFOXYC2_FULL_41_25]OGC41646.1 MAG: hypothetical protein A2548_04715 [candidate division WOR-1 bacterium RIFOXYD2_FULL_41_8]
MVKDTPAITKEILKARGQITSDKLAGFARISRQAAHKYLAKLVKQKKLLKIGKTRKSYYLPYSSQKAKRLARRSKTIRLQLKNKNLQEDLIFDRLSLTANLVRQLPDNAKGIFRYAFTEILNNAIEHSKSPNIAIDIYEQQGFIFFKIVDHGIGIFNKLKSKYRLKDNFEAVQELLKGKITTAPKAHSGEGIFFTSKIADCFIVEAAKIKLVIDNKAADVFVEDIANKKGTGVTFQFNKNSKKELKTLFAEYTNEDFKFSKTKVTVKLYQHGVDYVSRSQARRLLYGLEKFEEILLDFKGIKGIGQSFADEIFRVFASEHPNIALMPNNTAASVVFMIKRAQEG